MATYTPAQMAAAILAIPMGGLYSFSVNANEHLILYYEGQVPPKYRIDGNGHLILEDYTGYPALEIQSKHLIATF